MASAWELGEESFRLSITVPANTHATVRLPAQSAAAVTEGGQPLATGNGIRSVEIVDGIAVIEVESGHYEFIGETTPR